MRRWQLFVWVPKLQLERAVFSLPDGHVLGGRQPRLPERALCWMPLLLLGVCLDLKRFGGVQQVLR